MTARGLPEGRTNNPLITIARRPASCVASCWVEPRPDIVSMAQWSGIQATLSLINNAVPGAVDTTRFFRDAVPGAVLGIRMQMIWHGRDGEVRPTLLLARLLY